MKRTALLDAAEAVLSERGSSALTLNAVAGRAGVSKGGLLYHFPNKEALVQALIERLVEEFDALLATYDDGTPGSYTRAYVEATFAVITDRDESPAARRWTVVSAAATDVNRLGPIQRAMARWHGRDPEEDPDPLLAEIVRLAAEGLWEVAILDPGRFDDAHCAALRQRMLDLLA